MEKKEYYDTVYEHVLVSREEFSKLKISEKVNLIYRLTQTFKTAGKEITRGRIFHKDITDLYGLSRTSTFSLQRLSGLIPELLEDLDSNIISQKAAECLAGLRLHEQKQVYDKAIKEGVPITQKKAKEIVDDIGSFLGKEDLSVIEDDRDIEKIKNTTSISLPERASCKSASILDIPEFSKYRKLINEAGEETVIKQIVDFLDSYFFDDSSVFPDSFFSASLDEETYFSEPEPDEEQESAILRSLEAQSENGPVENSDGTKICYKNTWWDKDEFEKIKELFGVMKGEF